ncbi:helix-turn-helix transcriptional regulator [Flavonifractor sp.]|uniref:helix-turn-helix domain-containing protein n=1 Tax=Flavonifractor sp. TaxID=2049025 RepID=UPI0025BC139A|nr:helix-turn-helix transcriptional regulator [Flavonifractor sp.]
MDLGERLYQLRKARNLSQGEVADALGVSRQSVSKWENNTSVPELDKLVKLGELFGLTLDELVKGEAAPAPAGRLERPRPASGPAGGRRIAAIALLVCGGVGSLLFCTTLLIYLTLWLVLAGLLCWHVQEHLGLCLGLSFWMFLVVYFQVTSILSPWNVLIPAVYRAYPPSYILLDWLLLLPLLLFLGLAVRAAWRRFDRPALLRLGLAVGLFAVVRAVALLPPLFHLVWIRTSTAPFYYPFPDFFCYSVLVIALFPLPWGGYRRRPFVVLAAWALSFGLDRLASHLFPYHIFLSYYWPLLLLLFYLAAAWAGAVWERRAARRS